MINKTPVILIDLLSKKYLITVIDPLLEKVPFNQEDLDSIYYWTKYTNDDYCSLLCWNVYNEAAYGKWNIETTSDHTYHGGYCSVKILPIFLGGNGRTDPDLI